ncbi:MAG TPA: Crp/Fnr family transcriptional regulator [Candidatus Saccharimonadales bacterium]|nr:Crp/Fnr family transcriptional regulator [Candidatus Saccharimonadales bacterium]
MGNQVALNYLHTFLDRHATRTFRKGEIIVFQGEAPRSAYVVKSGTVKAYNLSVDGDEKPVAFYAEDSVFPAPWVYGKMPNSIYYYEAFTPNVEVYVIDRGEFVDFIKKRPELLYQELERVLVNQLGGSMRLNALQHSRASDKLVYTLHYLALSHGQPASGNKVRIKLDLKHQDFANLTGLTRETAATELNRLKKKGIIDYGKGVSYQLDMKRLKQALNDQFVSDIDVSLEA